LQPFWADFGEEFSGIGGKQGGNRDSYAETVVPEIRVLLEAMLIFPLRA